MYDIINKVKHKSFLVIVVLKFKKHHSVPYSSFFAEACPKTPFPSKTVNIT